LVDQPNSAYAIILGKAKYSNSEIVLIVSDHSGASIPRIFSLGISGIRFSGDQL